MLPLVKADDSLVPGRVVTLSSYPPKMLTENLTGVGEKTPAPRPVSWNAVGEFGEFETAPGVVEEGPADRSVVEPAESGAVDEVLSVLLLLPLVEETGSWGWAVCGQMAIANKVAAVIVSRLISRGTRSSLGWSKNHATALSEHQKATP